MSLTHGTTFGSYARWAIAGVGVLGCSGLLWGSTWVQPARPVSGAPRTPVLVELFTSEGCSSCPPADQLLILLDAQQVVAEALVIPLSEHVEYWNGLGWRDPFSAPTFTQRQQEYADVLTDGLLYTPQMVVDGQTELIGSQREVAQQAIARAVAAPKAAIALATTGGGGRHAVNVEVTISGVARLGALGEADLWLAVTEEGLATDVRRGENANRRLPHAAVVRRLERIETLPMPAPDRFTAVAQVALDPDWQAGSLRLVAFLQERKSRRVLGVTQIRLK